MCSNRTCKILSKRSAKSPLKYISQRKRARFPMHIGLLRSINYYLPFENYEQITEDTEYVIMKCMYPCALVKYLHVQIYFQVLYTS